MTIANKFQELIGTLNQISALPVTQQPASLGQLRRELDAISDRIVTGTLAPTDLTAAMATYATFSHETDGLKIEHARERRAHTQPESSVEVKLRPSELSRFKR